MLQAGIPGPSVICLGAAVLDHALMVDELPRQPIKIPALQRATRCGGPAATAAVACTALGVSAELWSCIGRDREGEFLREQLCRRNVGLEGLRCLEGVATMLAVVLVDRHGERMIVAHDGGTLPRPIDHLPLGNVARSGAVLADSSWPAGAAALLRAAAAAHVPSVLDAEEGLDDALLSLAIPVSLPVFSEAAFGRLSHGAAPDPASCAALAARMGTDLGVTLGARGSLWWLGSACTHVPALRVMAKDTTGAGDVFHGALAVGLAEHRPTLDAVRFATAAAGLKCKLGNGWDGMPEREAVEQAMRHWRDVGVPSGGI